MVSLEVPATFSAAALVYYFVLIVGGIGIGYFVMRLTNPEARLLTQSQKLLRSAAYGFMIVAIGLAADFAYSSDDFWQGKGVLPLTLFVTVLACVFLLKLKNIVLSPKISEVYVPTQKPTLHVQPKESGGPVAGAKTGNAETPSPAPTGQKAEAMKETSLAELQARRAQEEKDEGREEEEIAAASKIEFVKEDSKGKEDVLKKLKQSRDDKQNKEEIEKMTVEIVAGAKAEKKSEKAGERKEELGEIPKKQFEKAYASPQEEEEEIIHEVYSQLEVSRERASVGDKLKLAPPPAEPGVQQKIAGSQKSELSSLLQIASSGAASSTTSSGGLGQQGKEQAAPASTGLAGTQAGGSGSLFEQLSMLGNAPQPAAVAAQQTAQVKKPDAAPPKKQDVKLVKIAPQSGGCPRCHAANSRIVFCPYCGSAMCANCAPMIKPVQDGFEYTCPKCGEGVFIKKQAK